MNVGDQDYQMNVGDQDYQMNVGDRGCLMNVRDQDYQTYVLIISKSRLKSSIGTSTLMAGFALIAIVTVTVADGTPVALLIPYAMTTGLLIFIHLLSLIIATRLLPEIEAFIKNPKLSIPQSITKGQYWPVQLVWYLSNIVGVLLFMVELVGVTYVRYYPKSDRQADRMHMGTAILAVLLTLSLVSLPFVATFFRSLSREKNRYHERKLRRARNLLESINYSEPDV